MSTIILYSVLAESLELARSVHSIIVPRTFRQHSKGFKMQIYDVYFEDIYQGYAWASHDFDAIIKVAGDACICENGQRDYRWYSIKNYI